MSIYDDLRAVTVELFATFGVPAIVTTTAPGTKNRITDTTTPGATTTKPVLATLGKRKITSDDGQTTVQTTAKLNGSAKYNDRLTVGSNSYVITSVTENAPDGGVPFLWEVTLK